VRQARNLKIPVEGHLLRGYTIPQLAEVKLWDVRIKREGVDAFLDAINALDFDNNVKKYPNLGDMLAGHSDPTKQVNGQDYNNLKYHLPFGKLVRYALRFVRKVAGHNPEYVRKTNTGQSLPKKGWMYSFFISNQNDPESRPGNEAL
jgi:hypothetical protein